LPGLLRAGLGQRHHQRTGTATLFHFPGGGVIQFGNNPLLPGVWIAAATSLPLGNIEIDQAVVSTIAARIAAAKVTLVRMTPTSRSVSRRISFGAYGGGKSVDRLTQTGDYFAMMAPALGPRLRHSTTPSSATPPKRDEIPPVDHSIISSASNCIEIGISMPSVLAVLRLITSSNLVDS